MRISAITICVNYADHLAHGLSAWRDGLDQLLVVTAPHDMATLELADRHGVPVHRTDVFYARQAQFNKGAAIAEAFDILAPDDWVLLFDADCDPAADWRKYLDGLTLERDRLYGCFRNHEDGTPILDKEIAGFFHLFHSSCPPAQCRPIVDTHWTNASCYDTTFLARFPKDKRSRLPLQLTHYGPIQENWCGRGNTAAMAHLLSERQQRRGWRHETL